MTGISGKIVLATLGAFLGLMFFGVSVSLVHFNRLVEPRQPLQLLEWRLEEEQPGILLLGEDLHVKVDMELPGMLWKQAVAKSTPLMDEVTAWSVSARWEIEKSGWPEKALGLWNRITAYISMQMGRLK